MGLRGELRTVGISNPDLCDFVGREIVFEFSGFFWNTDYCLTAAFAAQRISAEYWLGVEEIFEIVALGSPGVSGVETYVNFEVMLVAQPVGHDYESDGVDFSVVGEAHVSDFVGHHVERLFVGLAVFVMGGVFEIEIIQCDLSEKASVVHIVC